MDNFKWSAFESIDSFLCLVLFVVESLLLNCSVQPLYSLAPKLCLVLFYVLYLCVEPLILFPPPPILLNCLSVFFCSSLSIFGIIILNYLSVNCLCIYVSLESSKGSLLFPLVVSCFPDSLWSIRPCICVCTFEEAVTSFRLYGLTSVRKDLYLWVKACWRVLWPWI